MGPVQAIKTCLRKSFHFSGRASRSEFWWFFAAWIVVMPGLLFVVGWTHSLVPGHLPTIIAWKSLKAAVTLMLLLPLGAMARRHHDAGFPAFLTFLTVIPGVVLLVNSLMFISLLLYGTFPFARPLLSWNPAAFFALLALITLSSLLALWPPSPGPNRYGPNPLEVTP